MNQRLPIVRLSLLVLATIGAVSFCQCPCGDPSHHGRPAESNTEDRPGHPHTAQTETDTAPHGALPETGPAEEAETAPKGLAKKEPKESLVGGCGEECGSAKAAVVGFLKAALTRTSEGMPFIRFVETTTLVDNGVAHGEKWSNLFLEGKLPERAQLVKEWEGEFRTRVGAPIPPEELEPWLGSGLSMNRLSSTTVRFDFNGPALEGASVSGSWSITVSLRGLEWLVSEIVNRR